MKRKKCIVFVALFCGFLHNNVLVYASSENCYGLLKMILYI